MAREPRRDRQLTVQFTASDVEELQTIADVEDRDRAYLVVWFTRWAMKQYRAAGSLVGLKRSILINDEEHGLQLRHQARTDFFSSKDTETVHGHDQSLGFSKGKTGTGTR